MIQLMLLCIKGDNPKESSSSCVNFLFTDGQDLKTTTCIWFFTDWIIETK